MRRDALHVTVGLMIHDVGDFGASGSSRESGFTPRTQTSCPPLAIHVLIIEHSVLVRERLITILTGLEAGARISIADTGSAGRRMFALWKPDVVLVDTTLPEISGFDLLAEFKAERPSCIVMLLADCAYPEFRANSKRLRADYLLTRSLEHQGIAHVMSVLAHR